MRRIVRFLSASAFVLASGCGLCQQALDDLAKNPGDAAAAMRVKQYCPDPDKDQAKKLAAEEKQNCLSSGRKWVNGQCVSKSEKEMCEEVGGTWENGECKTQ